MSSLITREIIMTDTEHDAITNPNSLQNIDAADKARRTFSNISAGVNLNLIKPRSKKSSLRARLEILNGTKR